MLVFLMTSLALAGECGTVSTSGVDNHPVDLNDDGVQENVYSTSSPCPEGGCKMLVTAPCGDGQEIVLLDTGNRAHKGFKIQYTSKTNGWKDIVVSLVQDDDSVKDVTYTYDGNAYAEKWEVPDVDPIENPFE